jgi:hypothetical protein
MPGADEAISRSREEFINVRKNKETGPVGPWGYTAELSASFKLQLAG